MTKLERIAAAEELLLTRATLVPAADEADEISLFDLLAVILKRKWLVLGTMLVATMLAGIVALSKTSFYRAEVLFASADAGKGSGLIGSLAGQLGGLASLAGIQLPAGGATDNNLATLQSRAFTLAFIRDNDLKKALFPNSWDGSSNQWIAPEVTGWKKLYAALGNVVVPSARGSDSAAESWEPSDTAAVKAFEAIRTVQQDKGLLKVAIQWNNPLEAAQWANKFVAHFNEHARAAAIQEAETSIKYLNRQLAETSLVDVRQILYSLVESQTKTMMLANVQDEFAFRVIDPAVPPEEPAGPKRRLIVVLGCLGGLMLGVMLAFGHAFFGQFRDQLKRAESHVENL